MKKIHFHKQLYSNIFLSFLVLSCMCFLNGCGTQEPLVKSDFLLDTIVTVTLYDSKEERIIDGCLDLCRQYENLFSKTIDDSDIAKINNAHGKPVTVSTDTIALIQKGIEYGELSNGLFDITIGPVSDMWDFKSDAPKAPDDKALQNALAHVDYKAIQVNEQTVTLTDPDAKIDLGGIAKGYIADRMKEYLLTSGVNSATINLGGNVLTVGTKPDKDPFFIGIQKPFEDRNTIITPIAVTDQSIVSSGPYERFFYDESGKLYHHILDTKTGYPVQNSLYGVTIISDKSVDGDALSTTCFALGLEKGFELIESLDGIEAVFIDNNYQLIYTDRSME